MKHTDVEQQITIDGPAASGKSTVAKAVAEKVGAFYVDTGAMYRVLTWYALEQGVVPQTAPAAVARLLADVTLELQHSRSAHGRGVTLILNGTAVSPKALRAPRVTEQVSFTAKIPEVRDWMVRHQRNAHALGWIVMEGRDIGTVVFPHARYKFFLTATPEERARRRLAQADENARGATVESVAADIRERDRIDSTRDVSPLKPAADATIVDTTGLSIAAVVDRIVGSLGDLSLLNRNPLPP